MKVIFFKYSNYTLYFLESLSHFHFTVPNLRTGRLERIITALTKEEEEMFRNMMRRIHTIARTAKEKDVRVMIDAEQTYFQPSINRITMELMRKYNKEKAIIFNTYQCYLKVRFRLNLVMLNNLSLRAPWKMQS